MACRKPGHDKRDSTNFPILGAFDNRIDTRTRSMRMLNARTIVFVPSRERMNLNNGLYVALYYR